MNSYKRMLINYIKELIDFKGKRNSENYVLSLKDLDDDEIGKLVSLQIEINDRDLCECVYGSDFSINNDYTCLIIKLIKNDSHENREDLSRVIRRNVINYFGITLQDLIDECCSEYFYEEMSSIGYSSFHDQENGEILWRRTG